MSVKVLKVLHQGSEYTALLVENEKGEEHILRMPNDKMVVVANRDV